ncbi:hypothetical protein AX16_001059 [Volvariella volvacea WC 439]|nr:hypothetical protein AX16_001059 [Volvariella volvacea WC 439]
MEYRPRYPQPFTLADAVQLDVSTITQEIARLQDSIRRLKETQTALQEIASSTPSGEVVDPEYERAIEENRVVM